MKSFFADLLGFLYFAGLMSLAVFFFPLQFKALTTAHPLAMGFVKVALLATFGEYLKRRIAEGSWAFDSFVILVKRFLGWVMFGIWFALAFPLFSTGVDTLIASGLWPSGPLVWTAFSKSLFINILGGFGWVMMLSHEWLNESIRHGRVVDRVEFGRNIDPSQWYGKVPAMLVLFWLPAHTLTFCLPGVWRILMAATLSVVLGFLLTLKVRRSSENDKS